MAKGSNGLRNKKTHSSKPYDVSNSFVKKVASRVTSFLPQTSWLSKWFTSADESQKPEENDSESDDDTDINPPSRKRAKIEVNPQIPVNNYRAGAFTSSEVAPERTDASMLLDQAGPSGFSRVTGRQQLASSTPIENEARTSLTSGHLNMRPRLLLSNSTTQPSPVVNNIDRKMNGDDRSESSESTSGCSSLLPQVNRQLLPGELQQECINRTSERISLGNHMGQRSLMLNRTRSPNINTPLSRRRTMFNVSSFTSPLEADKSLSRSAVINSPFYQGRTSYGGASALRKSRDVLFSPRETCIRRTGIEVKPINAENSKGPSEMTTMSQTARRILEALEQFSSPIQDAKKMVVGQGAFPVLGSKRPRPEAKQQESRPASSLRQLSIPTVPDLIKLRRREKLQDSLEAARIIANSATQESSYQLRLENSSAVGKVLGKKANIENEETVEEVHLPSVPLPITSLPKFDIIVPETNKSMTTEKFKFSSPIVVSEISRTVPTTNNFTFSKPYSVANFIKNSLKNVKVSEVGNFIPCCPSKLDSTISNPEHSTVTQFKSANIVSVKNNGPTNFVIETASELKSGSVSDILGKSKPEDSTKSPVNMSFGNAFKPPPDTWECSTCLIRNKQEATRCVACSESRVSPNATGVVLPTMTNADSVKFKFGHNSPPKGNDTKSKLDDFSSQQQANSVSSKPFHNEQQSYNIGEKFKPPGNTWECQTCMVRNNETHVRCQACETPKSVSPVKVPSLVDKFKKPADSWECPTCMVSNGGNILKCVACEEPKPGSSNDAKPQSSTKFNIDIPAESKMFKFGVNRDDVQISTPTNTVTPGFKFGETQKVAMPTNFTFGIKSSNEVCVPESITSTSADTTSKTDNFTFAVPQASTLKQSLKDAKKIVDSVDSGFDSKDNKNDSNLNFISQPNKVMQNENLSEDNVNQPDNTKTAKEIGVSNQLPPTTITFTALKPPVSVNEKQESSTPQFKFIMPTNSGQSSEMSVMGNKSNPFSFGIKPNADICPVSSSTNSTVKSGEKAGFTFSPFVQQATTQSTTEEKSSNLQSTPITTLANNSVTGGKGTVASNFGQTIVTSSQNLNKVDARIPTADQVGQTISSSASTLGATAATSVVSTAPSPFSATTFATASGSLVSAPVSVSSSTLTSLSVTTTTVANFGNLQTTAVSTSGSVTSSSAPSFGSNVAPVPAFGSSTGSTFGFGSSSVPRIANFGIPVTTAATKPSITFGMSANPPATFGNTKSGFEQVSDIPKPFGFPASDSISAKPALSPFGTATTPNNFGNSNAAVPGFGNPVTTSSFVLSTTAPSFGLSVPAFTSAPSFDTINSSITVNSAANFNNAESSINSVKPSTSPFVFSANSNKASPFSFTSQNNTQVASIPPAKITGFSFGSSNNSNPSSGNMPQPSGFANYSFGANAPTANAPAPNMFGSTATAPAFGSSNAGSGFAQPSFFGSNPQANSIFGSPANQGTSTQPVQNSTPVFTFGTASAQPAGLPTFDPAVKPSYNFTRGETPSFTAEPAVQQRRFKKALRRTTTTPHVR